MDPQHWCSQIYGLGIRKKPIQAPGSRGQKGTGSQIPDPDPQHWLWIVNSFLLAARIRIQISILMPIQIRIRIWIGIKTMPIHMRILTQFYTCWKIGTKTFTFVLCNASLQCFSLLINSKGVMDFSNFDSMLKFFGKK
jgi:hypothetical protein